MMLNLLEQRLKGLTMELSKIQMRIGKEAVGDFASLASILVQLSELWEEQEQLETKCSTDEATQSWLTKAVAKFPKGLSSLAQEVTKEVALSMRRPMQPLFHLLKVTLVQSGPGVQGFRSPGDQIVLVMNELTR